MLKVENISKSFKLGKGIIHAVKNVSFEVNEGDIFGIGGESGSGKSTIAKMILQLLPLSSGAIYYEGKKIDKSSLDKLRKNVQIVLQNPSTALNPRMIIKDILSEPYQIHRQPVGDLGWLLEQVGLPAEFLTRLPHQLSGGQKQRVAIARALALKPKLLVLDEPFSALDISVTVHLIQLLKQLKHEFGLTYILISHDLSVIKYLTNKMAIMYLGEIVEIGKTEEVFGSPLHPYTQGLLEAILTIDPGL